MKVLVVACYSPFINNSAAIETLWYLNKLSSIEGNEVHLLTVKFGENSIYYDKGVLDLLHKKVKVHAVEGGALFNLVIPKKNNSGTVSVTNSKAKSKIKSLLRNFKNRAAVPDPYIVWAFKASKYAAQKLNMESFDVMLSMHEPPSSHICGYLIKKKYKDLKWVTYWSDPWIKDPSRENHGALRKSFEGRVENKIVKLSEKFIFVTDDNRKDYIDNYKLNPDKTYLINRGYDMNEYSRVMEEQIPEHIDKDKINIVYTGEIFSKLRDIRPFISVLEMIKIRDRDIYDRLNVLFFGNIDNAEVAESLRQHNCAKVFPRIPYKDALRYMLNSDLLLLFGNKNSKQIPAKIYDYFGTNSYILVILGDPKDPIKKVVSDKEKCIVSENEEKILYEQLQKSILKITDKGNFSAEPLPEYEWSNIGKKLNDILLK